MRNVALSGLLLLGSAFGTNAAHAQPRPSFAQPIIPVAGTIAECGKMGDGGELTVGFLSALHANIGQTPERGPGQDFFLMSQNERETKILGFSSGAEREARAKALLKYEKFDDIPTTDIRGRKAYLMGELERAHQIPRPVVQQLASTCDTMNKRLAGTTPARSM